MLSQFFPLVVLVVLSAFFGDNKAHATPAPTRTSIPSPMPTPPPTHEPTTTFSPSFTPTDRATDPPTESARPTQTPTGVPTRTMTPTVTLRPTTATPTVSPVAPSGPSRPSHEHPCFSSQVTTVVDGKGRVAMKDLQVGDKVMTSSGDFQSIYAMDHFHKSKPTEFLQIHTALGNSENPEPLEVTSNHMIFLEGHVNPLPASLVKVGDSIKTRRNNARGHHSCFVTKITTVVRSGFYNVLTTDGTIVVNNGLIASNYPALLGSSEYLLEVNGIKLLSHQAFIHMALRPLRAFCMQGTAQGFCHNAGSSSTNSGDDNEHNFAWYSQVHNAFFQLIKEQHTVVQMCMICLAVLGLTLLNVVSTVMMVWVNPIYCAVGAVVVVSTMMKRVWK